MMQCTCIMYDGLQQSLCNAVGELIQLLISAPSYHLLSISYPASPRAIMSTIASTPTSHLSFTSIFNAALESYRRETKKDLTSHPLLPKLQSCESPEAILAVLQEQIPAFIKTKDAFTKWVIPTVNVLHAFSDTLHQAVGLVNNWILSYGELL